jgi:predicted secreted protein
MGSTRTSLLDLGRCAALVALGVAAAVLPGCAAPDEGGRGRATGSIELVAATRDALTAEDVAKVTLTISGPGIDAPIVNDLSHLGARWTGEVGGVPVGTERALHADAFDSSNTVIYSGDVAHVSIDTDQTAAVAVLLQQVSPPTPFANAVPLIDSFVASTNAVAPSHTLTLAVTAHDPDAADTLVYAWSATGGTFSAPGALGTTWTAPATSGAQTLTIRATDPKGSVAAMSMAVSVAPTTGIAAVAADFNTWPIVSGIVPSPARIDVGQTTALTLSAGDVDGDALTYAWTSACAGTFSSATDASPSFTLAAPLAGGSCALTLATSDGRGGQTSGSLVIQTGPGAPVLMPPQVDQTFQSATTVNGADVVTFRVRAHDPEQGALTFAWTANAGTLGTATGASGSSEITWTAPLVCQSGVIVNATITNAIGLSTVQAFKILFDTSIDPNNCGACGSPCGGAACKAGVCQVVTSWKAVSSGVTDVQAGGDGSVWGRKGTSALRWDGTAFVATGGPALAQIAVGNDGSVWGVGSDASVVHYEGGAFVAKTGSLSQIAVGATDATAWGVLRTTGQVSTYDGTSGFTKVTGVLVSVAAGGTEQWGLNSSFNVFRLNPTTRAFEARAGILNSLVITGTGVPWGFNATGDVYYWNGTAFTSAKAKATQIAAGADGTVWTLSSTATVQAWNGTAFEARGSAPIGTLTALSVGNASSIWAVDAAAQRAFKWGTCVAGGQWSSTATVCCSGQWASTNKCL